MIFEENNDKLRNAYTRVTFEEIHPDIQIFAQNTLFSHEAPQPPSRKIELCQTLGIYIFFEGTSSFFGLYFVCLLFFSLTTSFCLLTQSSFFLASLAEHPKTRGHSVFQLQYHHHDSVEEKRNWGASVQCMWTLL